MSRRSPNRKHRSPKGNNDDFGYGTAATSRIMQILWFLLVGIRNMLNTATIQLLRIGKVVTCLINDNKYDERASEDADA